MSPKDIVLPSEGAHGEKNGAATATCYCGAVQIEVPTEGEGLVDTFICHCTDCRKITASMFASNFVVKDSHLKHLRGESKLTKFKQSATIATGNWMENSFCSVCGTLMYRRSEGFPGMSIPRIGTIDDFGLQETKFKPRIETFEKDRLLCERHFWSNRILRDPRCLAPCSELPALALIQTVRPARLTIEGLVLLRPLYAMRGLYFVYTAVLGSKNNRTSENKAHCSTWISSVVSVARPFAEAPTPISPNSVMIELLWLHKFYDLSLLSSLRLQCNHPIFSVLSVQTFSIWRSSVGVLFVKRCLFVKREERVYTKGGNALGSERTPFLRLAMKQPTPDSGRRSALRLCRTTFSYQAQFVIPAYKTLGAEIVQLLSACVDLTKTIVTIAEAAKSSHGLPPKIFQLFEELPAVQSLFEKFQQHHLHESRDNTNVSVTPVLRHCEQDLRSLSLLFENVCPKDEANRLQRTWKGTTALISGKHSKLQELWTSILGHLEMLETKQILDIGDQLDSLNDTMSSMANEHESTYNYNVSGSMYHNEGGAMFHNSGAHNTNYQSGGNQSFVFNSKST
ncbi:hypothetical protein BST61_g7681 [Cercospora zeina]